MSEASKRSGEPMPTKSQDKFIDLPDINLEGLLQNGVIYYRSEDVYQWLRECVEVARANDIPVEVAIYVAGMADSLKRAKAKSGF